MSLAQEHTVRYHAYCTRIARRRQRMHTVLGSPSGPAGEASGAQPNMLELGFFTD